MRPLLIHVAGLAALCASLAACQPANRPPPAAAAPPRLTAAAQVPINGVGYIALNTDITSRSRDLLIQAIGHLVDAGATTIDLAINSRGGSTDAAVAIANDMARQHATRGVTFAVYDTGLVASAATYIFLGAQHRYAAPRASFLFHAAGFFARDALVSAQMLRERANEVEAYERLVRAALKAHTRLSPGAIETYITRTVILSAEDARRDGVIDDIAEFRPPDNAIIANIVSRPTTPPRLFPAAPN